VASEYIFPQHSFKSLLLYLTASRYPLPPFLDGYCSTVQGLLDWFEVDLGFTEFLFIQIDLCVMCVFVVYSPVSLSSCILLPRGIPSPPILRPNPNSQVCIDFILKEFGAVIVTDSFLALSSQHAALAKEVFSIASKNLTFSFN